MLNIVIECDIISGFLSDHSAITLTLNLCETVRGNGYFKLNNSLLLQNEFKQNIKDTIQETATNNNGCNPNTMWELIKGSVRNEAIKYSCKLKKKQKRGRKLNRTNNSTIGKTNN